MKWLILVLTVINIAYLALHLTAHPATEAQQAHTPLHAGRIVLLPPGSVKPVLPSAPADNSVDNSAEDSNRAENSAE